MVPRYAGHFGLILCMMAECIRLKRTPLQLQVLRGGVRFRTPQQKLKVITINVTSLMLHWRSIADIEADIIHVVETRVAPAEQSILTTALLARGWETVWSPPPPGAGAAGMRGRSGGCLVMLNNGCKLLEKMEIGLANPEHCSIVATYQNDITNSMLIQATYYGHPAEKARTREDHAKLSQWAQHLGADLLLCGDFNIDDEDDEPLALEGGLLDAAWIKALQTGEQPDKTFHGPAGATRLDRIFCSPGLQQHLQRVYCLADLYLPGHDALVAEFDQRVIEHDLQVAKPSLVRAGTTTEVGDLENEIERQWQDLQLEQLEVDDLYEWWSAAWERYLRRKFGHPEHLPRAKGRVAAVRRSLVRPFASRLPLLLRRLSNYLQHLKHLKSQLAARLPGSPTVWRAVTRASNAMATYYGAPVIPPFEEQAPDNLAEHVIDATYAHFRNIWDRERRQLQHTSKQNWRGRSGQGKWSQPNHRPTPRQEKVLLLPSQSERGRWHHCHQSGSRSRQSTTSLASILWSRPTTGNRPRRLPEMLPPLRGADLLAAVRAKAKGTSAGADSWTQEELAILPLSAMNALAAILEICEAREQLPRALCVGWFTLVPKDEAPSPPLGIRPISILPLIYRTYATVRAQQVQQWAQNTFGEEQLAYVRGRQTLAALTELATEIDYAEEQRQPLYLLSLDTSKAFPSACHEQIWELLSHYGFPPPLIGIMQQLYAQSQFRFRYGGQAVGVPVQLLAGIHQGCPLSVLAFNILLKPMCDRVLRQGNQQLQEVQLVVFADDVTIKTTNYQSLLATIQIITDHFRALGFQLNESKTQYWRVGHDPQHNVVMVNNVIVAEKADITILGWVFDKELRRHKMAKGFIEKCRRLAADCGRLPMTTSHKINAIAGIFYAGQAYCPWRCYLSQQVDISKARLYLLQAAMRHHVRGPRASAILTVHCVKGHRADPQVAIIYKMIRLVGSASTRTLDFIQYAYDNELPPRSLNTSLAHALRRMGGLLQAGRWTTPTTQQVDLRAPPKQQRRDYELWSHSWRRALRTGALSTAVVHRHEYRELTNQELDVPASTTLLRSLLPSRDRSYVELALAGGMITNAKCQRHRGPPHTLCNYDCGVPDTDLHRFWECPHWRRTRPVLGQLWDTLPEITKCTGWATLQHPVPAGLLLAIQRHLAAVIKGSTSDYQARQLEAHDSDNDDDNDNDGDHNGNDDGGVRVGGAVRPPPPLLGAVLVLTLVVLAGVVALPLLLPRVAVLAALPLGVVWCL